MKAKYSKETLRKISARQHNITEDGLDILIKPIPETDTPGMLDPRLYESMAPMFKGIKGIIAKKMMGKMGKNQNVQKAADGLRKMMNGVKSIPIVVGVKTTPRILSIGGRNIPVRIYNLEQPLTNESQPIFYYIHGGGFVAGGPDVVEEMCKMVVKNTGCVSVTLDYRLAPEHPYPAGLDDCYDVLKWIYKHAAEFGGNAQKICISGDSAGGNLATVCAMRDRDDSTKMVKVQALLYPTVNMANMNDSSKKGLDAYDIHEEHAHVVKPLLEMMSGMGGGMSLEGLLGVKDATQPYLSPYLGNLNSMPPCLMIYGEYDFLRFEDEAYSRKLKQAGVEVKTIRYRGLSHGFADQVGVTPQAEDSLIEIGNFMMKHFG